MKIGLSLSLLLFVLVSSCSNANEQSNVGTPDTKTAETVANNSEVNIQNTPVPTLESKSPPNPKDVVRFDGKNYIKKSGWKVPTRDETYVDDTYDQGDPNRKTANGKQVKTNTILYGYRNWPSYSEEFYYDGDDLDYRKGKLRVSSFLEMSVKGKVFLYSIFAETVVTPPPSNNDPHEDPFVYQIMDKNGDGIFETLLGDADEIIVPNWVLK